jgi:DNA repair photolyase
MVQVGITERGDAALNTGWKKWVGNGQPAILITKNVIKLIEENKQLLLNGNVIIHATVTGLGSTKWEPNVPNYKKILEFLEKQIRYGFPKERLVIRCDPIFIPFMDPEIQSLFDYKSALTEILNFAIDNNLRYRISFFDYYPHIRERIKDLSQTPAIKKLNQIQPDLHADIILRQGCLDMIKNYIKDHNSNLEIEICGEPDLPCTGCLSKKDLDIFGIELDRDSETGIQRPTCACLGLKKELLNNKHPCAHGCLYCFWKDN